MLNKIKKAKKKQDKAKFDRLNEEFKKHFEKGDKIPVETTEWKRGIGDTTSTFKLTVSPLTGWKKRYHFTFTFYDKPDRDSKFITKIVDSIIKKLQTDLEDSGQITYTKVNDLLNGVIKKETEEMKLNKGYQFLDANQIKLQGKRVIGTFKFDNHPLVATIHRMAVDKFILNIEGNKRKELMNKVINIADSDLEKLIKGLKAILDKAIKDDVVENLPFDLDDIELMQNLKKKPEMVPKDFAKKFRDINTTQWAFKTIPSDANKILQKLISAFKQVYYVNGIRSRLDENMSKIIEDLKKILANFYVKHSVVFVESKVPFTSDETELDRLRVGTIYGLGGAILNTSDGKKLNFQKDQVDLFSYIGIKYYLGPVDRRRPKPFLTNMSRWSIHIGAVFKSEITYKGQDMVGLFGDMIPTFGIGFDLNPTFCLNLGVLLFKQPSVNPLSEAKNKKWALFLGFSYDMDLFNRIKGLLNPSN